MQVLVHTGVLPYLYCVCCTTLTLTATRIRPESSLASSRPPSAYSASILFLFLLPDPEVRRSLGSVTPPRDPCWSLAEEPLVLLLLPPPPPGGRGYARGDDTGVAPRLLVDDAVRSVEALGEPSLLPLPRAPPHRGDAGAILPSMVLLNVGGVGRGMILRTAVEILGSDGICSIFGPSRSVVDESGTI